MEIICIRTVLADVYPLLRKDRPRVARNAYLTWLFGRLFVRTSRVVFRA